MANAKKKKNENSWNEIQNTSTRTELETSPDAQAQELLQAAMKSEPSLIVVQGENMGTVFRLKDGVNIIGRHPDCDVTLNQRAVSGVHAELKVGENEIILSDRNSTNGTILNRNKIDRPVVLRANDLIKIGSFVLKFTDTKLDAQFTESLQERNNKDPLTGAANKAHLVKALQSSIDIAKNGFALSIIILDIDHFKQINDTHGHLAGDFILKELCRVIKDSVIRSEDVLARFGGEEFVLILPDSPLHVAASIAERIRKTIEEHSFVYANKAKIPVTASLGVAAYNERYKNMDAFIDAADRELYNSKKSGRNRVSVAPE